MVLFHVNRIPFLRITPERLGVRTSQVLSERLKESLLLFAQEVMSFFEQHNYNANPADADLEFNYFKNSTDITMIIVYVVSHYHPDKFFACTTKELCCLLQALTLGYIPKVIVFGSILDCANNPTLLQINNSIVEHISPLNVAASVSKLHFNLLKDIFSNYVES